MRNGDCILPYLESLFRLSDAKVIDSRRFEKPWFSGHDVIAIRYQWRHRNHRYLRAREQRWLNRKWRISQRRFCQVKLAWRMFKALVACDGVLSWRRLILHNSPGRTPDKVTSARIVCAQRAMTCNDERKRGARGLYKSPRTEILDSDSDTSDSESTHWVWTLTCQCAGVVDEVHSGKESCGRNNIYKGKESCEAKNKGK